MRRFLRNEVGTFLQDMDPLRSSGRRLGLGDYAVGHPTHNRHKSDQQEPWCDAQS